MGINVFLAHSVQQHNWRADLQGCAVNLTWDENQKPIPLLCLEQTQDRPTTQLRRPAIRAIL